MQSLRKLRMNQREKWNDIVGIACGVFLVIVAIVNIVLVNKATVVGAGDAKIPSDAIVCKGSAPGKNGDITVEVRATADHIYQIKILSQEETQGIGSEAVKKMPGRIYDTQSLLVDGVSGATISSNAIKEAIRNALLSAGLDPAAFEVEVEHIVEEKPFAFPLPWESEAETNGEVKATRTYTLQNAMDSVVTELYVYPSAGTDKGENLAGDGLVRGEQVYVTVTGYMLHTENVTLYTVEFVADGQRYNHTTLHVEDLLNDKIVYLVGVDGVSSATPLSFSVSNLPDGDDSALVAEAIVPAPLEDTPETRGEVKATRTYVLQNRMDETITELYVYPSAGEDKGENLAGDGLEKDEAVRVTVTGYMLHTENETLFTIEYVAGGQTYAHRTVHVEDLLFDKPIYLIGVDGISSATPVSFGGNNIMEEEDGNG